MKHPAKFTDSFIPIFYELLSECTNVLDPMGGTGKLALIKKYGYKGNVHINEIEPEWICNSIHLNLIDGISHYDAEFMRFGDSSFDAVCTSPTYGNRMADHHNAKDGSKRNTYTHTLGRALNNQNTGKMQWGAEYKEKHRRIYTEIKRVLKKDGIFIINISNHIRKGVEIDVCGWTVDELIGIGFELMKQIEIETPRLKYGANAEKRSKHEFIYVFRK